MFRLDGQRVLVLSPHQDDLEIGCGGLVQQFLEHGSDVYVVHGTIVDLEGRYKKYDKQAEEYREYTGAERMHETHRALSILGKIHLLEPLLDSSKHHRVDEVPLVQRVGAIEQMVKLAEPTVILVTAVSSNQDHEAFNRAVRSVMRPHFYAGAVIEYEIGDEAEFVPNLFVPMTEEHLQRKLESFAQYTTQQSGELHMVSPSGLKVKAMYRGKQCYAEFAEAFRIVRCIVS